MPQDLFLDYEEDNTTVSIQRRLLAYHRAKIDIVNPLTSKVILLSIENTKWEFKWTSFVFCFSSTVIDPLMMREMNFWMNWISSSRWAAHEWCVRVRGPDCRNTLRWLHAWDLISQYLLKLASVTLGHWVNIGWVWFVMPTPCRTEL